MSTDIEERPSDVAAPPDDGVGTPLSSMSPEVRDRFVLPLLLPLGAVIFLAVLALNISRLFLAGKGDPAVWVASTLTLVILVGAAGISASRRMRGQLLGVFVLVGMSAVLLGGLVTLGAAEEKHEEAAVEDLTNVPAVAKVDVVAGPGLIFRPSALTAPGGVVEFDVDAQQGGHTFTILGTPLDLQLTKVAAYKEKVRLTPNTTYAFECTIPGHAAAGMKGELVVGAAGTAPGALSRWH